MVVSTRPEGVSTARQWVCSGPRRRAPARRHPGHILAITNNHGAVAVAGPGPEALLLGVFQVSVLHKVVRFLFAPRGFHGRHLPAGAEFPEYCGQLAAPRPGPAIIALAILVSPHLTANGQRVREQLCAFR